MDKKKMPFTPIQVPLLLHKQLKILATAEDVSMAEFLQRLLDSHLDNQPHLQRILEVVEREMAHA